MVGDGFNTPQFYLVETVTEFKVNDGEMEETTQEEILFNRSANLFGLCPLEHCHGV